MALADQRLAQDAGLRDAEVTERLVRAYETYGLAAPGHFEEVGLKTMTMANVDFGIVTALPEELDAVLLALGSAQRIDKEGSDTHTYYEATLRTTRSDGALYRVVLVCCPTWGRRLR